ncbi:MAG: hypothetical protein GY822_21480 [Deltaproteobacteria bacterium]|nr:hypothetical protein [Deltaproteobacteria bacterium]
MALLRSLHMAYQRNALVIAPSFRAFWLWSVLLCLSSAATWAKENGDPPLIEHVEILEAPRGEDLEISAIIIDESGIFDPALLYRRGSEGDFKRLPIIKPTLKTVLARSSRVTRSQRT